MKTRLMFSDSDFLFDEREKLKLSDKLQDLGFSVILDKMANDDNLIYSVCLNALRSKFLNFEQIRYRQDALIDCINNSNIVKELYSISVQSETERKKSWLGVFSSYPSSILNDSCKIIDLYLQQFKQIRRISDTHIGKFKSQAFVTFFSNVQKQIDDEFITKTELVLKELQASGTHAILTLGAGNIGINHQYHQNKRNPRWSLRTIFDELSTPVIYIHERDEIGFKALGDIRDKAIMETANTLAQSSELISHFFSQLRIELSFYIGAIQLYDFVKSLNVDVSIAKLSEEKNAFLYKGLSDGSLAILLKGNITVNDGSIESKPLTIITGANQGGKSTFLRSVGQAYVMTHCGLFSFAKDLTLSVKENFHTHFQKEEDKTMEKGKLEEEMSRLQSIIQESSRQDVLFMNESLSSTNEFEGSQIAIEVTSALVDWGTQIFYVTHLSHFSSEMLKNEKSISHFLMAERTESQSRSFKIINNDPQDTSFGMDIYNEVFVSDFEETSKQHD